MVGVDQLKLGNKYTIVKFNRYGMPCKVQCRLTKIEKVLSGYRLMYKTNNFNEGICNLCPSYDVIIWEGWVLPDVGLTAHVEQKDEATQVLWRWAKYSPRYIERAKSSIPETPVFINYKPKKDNIPDRMFVIGSVITAQ